MENLRSTSVVFGRLTGLVVAILCSLPHSALQAQDQAAECRQQFASNSAEVFSALAADRRLDSIREKIFLGNLKEMPLSFLAIASKATEEERPVIEYLEQLRRDIRVRSSQLQQRCVPWAVPIFEMGAAAAFSLVADVYTGKTTYGEYNRQRMELTNKVLQVVREREIEVRREQQAAAQARAQINAQESAANSAALSNALNYFTNQTQLLNQQMQPSRIAPFTCNRSGNFTSCY